MLQGTLFAPECDWRAPRAADLPTDWNVSDRVCVDVETCDPLLKKLGPGVRRGGYICGLGFALSEDRGHYLPVRHLGGDNVEDPNLAWGYFRYQAKRFRGWVVGAKLGYDLDYLEEARVTFPNARGFKDVQVAEPLMDENQYSYSLDAILGRWELPKKDETVLRQAAAEYRLDPKKDLHKLPARYVGAYGEGDVCRPLTLLRLQEERIEREGLGRVWDLECKVLPVLVKMRRRGVRVDFDHLDRVERWSRAEEMKAWGKLLQLTGVSVPLGGAMKPELLARALGEIGIQCPKTPSTGKPSITKEFLGSINHPAADAIRRGRKVSQLRTTFVNAVREHAVNGRIHTTFNQVKMSKEEDQNKPLEELEGVGPGRLSCVDPNLQQQPGDKDPEIGPFWRSTYIPEEGAQWGATDYSQQEPRGAVHFAVVSGPRLIGQRAHDVACEAARRYAADRSTDAHDLFTRLVYGDAAVDSWDKVTYKTRRSHMKNVFLGISYGMGGPKLCRTLGFPTKFITIRDRKTGRERSIEVAGDEGAALLKLVDERAPYLRRTADAVQAAAEAKGYIITAGGRHIHFQKDGSGNYDWTHKAFNNAIQGTAADQTKEAMVLLDAEGFFLQLQVHDEFGLSLADREEGMRAVKIMENALPLKVVSKVDLELGSSWGDSMLPPEAERWWRRAA